jgi:hypothetical protein
MSQRHSLAVVVPVGIACLMVGFAMSRPSAGQAPATVAGPLPVAGPVPVGRFKFFDSKLGALTKGDTATGRCWVLPHKQGEGGFRWVELGAEEPALEKN